jgi:hypothetical protein
VGALCAKTGACAFYQQIDNRLKRSIAEGTMSNDDITERLARIEGQFGVIGPQVATMAGRLAMVDVDAAIADALAIRGLVGQINEVIHTQRGDLVAIANAQAASDAQSEHDRANITALLTQLHALALRHAARLTSWERAHLEVGGAAALGAE